MKNQLITILSSFFCSLIFTTSIHAQESIFDKLNAIATVDEKVMMPMRDGVRLASDIYRPKGEGKYPIIFSRTPYNFNSWGDGKQRTRTAKRAYEYVKRLCLCSTKRARSLLF